MIARVLLLVVEFGLAERTACGRPVAPGRSVKVAVSSRRKMKFEEDFDVPERDRRKPKGATMLAVSGRTSFLETPAEDLGLKFPVEHMMHVVAKGSVPKYLFGGSYGQTYLVQAPNSHGKEVIKIFYTKIGTAEPEGKWVTTADLSGDENLRERIAEAKVECSVARYLNEETTNAGFVGAGRHRIMDCYGNNFGTHDYTAPLYMALEYCGSRDLFRFLRRSLKNHDWTVEMILQIFKQILEALEYLQSFSEPFIHHDLKPENIAVKTHRGLDGKKFYTVYLIDLGEMVQTKASTDICQVTSVTAGYHGREYAKSSETCHKQNYDPAYPQHFDMFAVGSILLEMITGLWLPKLLAKVVEARRMPHPDEVWIVPGVEMNFDLLDKLVQEKDFLAHVFEVMVKDPNTNHNVISNINMLMHAHHTKTYKFIRHVVEVCLRADAKDRASAQQILDEEVMRIHKTPMDPRRTWPETHVQQEYQKEYNPQAHSKNKETKEYKKCRKLEKVFNKGRLWYMPDGSERCTGQQLITYAKMSEDNKLTAKFECDSNIYTVNLDCNDPKWTIIK